MNKELLSQSDDEGISSQAHGRRHISQTDSDEAREEEPGRGPVYSAPSDTKTAGTETDEPVEPGLEIEHGLYGFSKPKRRVIKGRIYRDED